MKVNALQVALREAEEEFQAAQAAVREQRSAPGAKQSTLSELFRWGAKTCSPDLTRFRGRRGAPHPSTQTEADNAQAARQNALVERQKDVRRTEARVRDLGCNLECVEQPVVLV